VNSLRPVSLPRSETMFRPGDYSELQKRTVPCACCGSLSQIPAFQGDRYGFGLQTVVCETCGLVFTSPRPDDGWFEEFYRWHYRNYYEHIDVPDESYLQRRWIRGRHQRNLELLSRFAPESGSLLDIGCAEGTFLQFFRERYPRWRIRGIEPSESFSAFARSYYGLDSVTTCTIEGLESWESNRFDLITASHVLEHLLDPNVFFATARRLLSEEGLLFIDVPDAEGKKKGIRNLHIAHVYHFSDQSLRNFLAKYGFDTLLLQKGSDKPAPWTLQLVAGKRGRAPEGWAPPPVDSTRVARAFAAHSRPTPRDRVRQLKRQIKAFVAQRNS